MSRFENMLTRKRGLKTQEAHSDARGAISIDELLWLLLTFQVINTKLYEHTVRRVGFGG